MPSLNKAILLGTLPRDPAFRFTPRGAPLCTFALQLPEVPGDNAGKGRRPPCHLRIVVWGRQAEACGQSLTVGSSVLVEGHLRLDVRTDREGQKESRLEVVAERVTFVDGVGRIRAAVPSEALIDRPAQDFEVDTPTQIPEADPPAPDE
jgi:single-strand DNA-binding protein